MGKIKRTFSVDFKVKTIEMYLHKGMTSKLKRDSFVVLPPSSRQP